MDDMARKMLTAAANMLRTEGIQRVHDASDMDERACANSALLASVTIEQFLKQADDLDRPF